MVGNASRLLSGCVCIAILGPVTLLGLNRIPALFALAIVATFDRRKCSDRSGCLNPAASAIATMIWRGFFTVGVIAIAVGLIATYVRSRRLRIALMIVVAVLMTSDVAATGSFLRDAAFRLLLLAVLWLGVTRVVRFNLMGYFLVSAMIVLIPDAVELLEQPNRYFHANGYAVLLCALGLLAWPLVMWRRNATES